MFVRGAWNLARRRPLTVSFEVTHVCTANCGHCNWGGAVKETRRTPEEYSAIYRELKTPVVNISGGEPMARGDLDDIVRAIAKPGGLPWIVVVSNCSQLTVERFRRLKDAGMHQLSASIDFPDDRHSAFRRIPGLFERMSEVIPQCVEAGDPDDITLNCCITAWNFRTLPDIVRLAARWGVKLNFSSYSKLRVDDETGLLTASANGARDDLRRSIEEVIELREQGYPVYTTAESMWEFYEFLVSGHRDGCRAGERFLVVNPDGRMTPCAMVMAYYNDQESMYREFTSQNTCGQCFISTRVNAEKSVKDMFMNNISYVKRALGLMPGSGRSGRHEVVHG
jgi:MoaA/NifB/PqqE/SkfB family radical SAM enzyme